MAAAIVGSEPRSEDVSSNRATLKEFLTFSANKLIWFNPPLNNISTIKYADLCGVERGIPPLFAAMMYLPFADVNPQTGADGIYELILTLPGGNFDTFDIRVKTENPTGQGECKLRPVDLFDYVYRAYQSNPQLSNFDNTTYFDRFAPNGPGRLRLILVDEEAGPS